jgi:hypothetical protein
VILARNRRNDLPFPCRKCPRSFKEFENTTLNCTWKNSYMVELQEMYV